jgi:LmbE family N-acetylglucosaminyl deacetylase
MTKIPTTLGGLALAGCLAAAVVPALRAQRLAPAGTGGIVALDRALRSLDQNKRVLVIGAHPDDEDNELVTFLSRGTGAEVAYLSLSRGEGGQNLIGSELGEGLGLLRSEELLSARSVDGAHQYFTRAFDFGFSKTLEETLRFWPRDTLLADVLRVIGRFRPQVVVSIFSGTPRDGHGQHQAAGVTARAAVELLRDSTWGPRKLFRTARFDTSGTTVVFASGALDPVVGQSYHQLAMASRSFHRSQEMGRMQDIGASTSRLALIEDFTGGTGGGLFAGTDTSLAPGLARYAALIDSARTLLAPEAPSRIVPLLAAALGELRANAPPEFREKKEPLLEEALASAAGVIADVAASDWRVVSGVPLVVFTYLWGASGPAPLDTVSLEAPPGWDVGPAVPVATPTVGGPFSASPRGITTRRFTITVPADAPLSQPYFLERPLDGALYDWSGVSDDLKGEPFQAPPLLARLETTIAGARVALRREVHYRYDDEALGEMRRPLAVVPLVGVQISPSTLGWPVAAETPRSVTVTLTHGKSGMSQGVVRLDVPPLWSASDPQVFMLDGEGAHRSYALELRPPRNVPPGRYAVRAVATVGRVTLDRSSELVDYPHIRAVAFVRTAATRIEMADLVLPRLSRVGYVRGAADLVPEALGAVGVPLVLLSADDLEKGDLSRYDVVVIGSRAYETTPALLASNGRLLDYARAGGRLIVQYQQYPFVQGGYAPFPLTIARPHDRVTDETAPVRVLDPFSTLFRAPNAIGGNDWDGWVQERGLYFAHTWDPAYRPMIETGDAGERLRGGLLAARLERGLYVYTGLSFFRQLPAGVPGAFRLFANLLALRPDDVHYRGRPRTPAPAGRRLPGRLFERQDSPPHLLAPRPRAALDAGAAVRGAAPRRERAVDGHGVAGGPRPPAVGACESAGRPVVRRPLAPVRPRGARLAPGAGGARRPPLPLRLSHAGGHRVQQRGAGGRDGAARLGRGAPAEVARQAPDPRPARERHDARDLRDGRDAQPPAHRGHDGGDGVAAPAGRADQGIRADAGAAPHEAGAPGGPGLALGPAGHAPARAAGPKGRTPVSHQRHAGHRRRNRGGAGRKARRPGARVRALGADARDAARRGAGRFPPAGAHGSAARLAP